MKKIMKLEYKQFEFAETLRDMDSVLLPEYDKLVPKISFFQVQRLVQIVLLLELSQFVFA